MARIRNPTKCTHCGHLHDAADNLDDPELRPSDGDVSICLECGAISLFVVADDGTLSLRKPTDEEHAELSNHPEVAIAQMAIMIGFESDAGTD